MKGTITKTTGKIGDKGAYIQLTIKEDTGEQKYSCFEKELFNDLKTGNTIEYEYYTSKDGQYRNIIKTKLLNQNPNQTINEPKTTNWPPSNPEKDNNILKQVCLKIAANNLSGLGMSNLEYAKKVVLDAKVLYNEIKDSGWLK